MRLSPEAAHAIREAVRLADPEADVWLFGSRANDAARGGDIDLLVVSERIGFSAELALRAAILDRIGWQRLDLAVRRRGASEDPLAALARESGVKL